MAPIFGPRSTTLIHAAEAVFLVSVLAVSGARIGLNGGIKSRVDSMSLAMVSISRVNISECTLIFGIGGKINGVFGLSDLIATHPGIS